MKLLILLLVLNGFSATALAVTPSVDDIYTKAYQIAEEIHSIKEYYNINEELNEPDVPVEMEPKYNWQKTYEILYKINILREKLGLSVIGVPSREPQLELPLQTRYEQMIRVITELQILKRYLDVTAEIPPLPQFKDKTTTDIYNVLNHASYEMDLINRKSLTPSDVFGQAVRVSEDVNFILDELGVKNTSIPPQKNLNAQPKDVFETTLSLLEEIKRLQKMMKLKGIDFHQLKPPSRPINPSDVFSIFGVVLAELQQMKAYLGLKYSLTPMAEHYENIQPADVQQLVGWNVRKLQLIRTLK